MSLAKIVQPLFWLSKPLGVLPLTLEKEQFVVSKLSQLYTICGTLCFLVGGLKKFVRLFFRFTKDAFSGQEILSAASNVIVMIFAALNIYYSMVCSRRIVGMLNDLGWLLKTVKDPDILKVAKHIRYMVFILQIAVFLSYMAFTIYESSFKSMDTLEIVVSTMRILSLTSISCIGTQFCALCLLLRTLVRALNDELRTCLRKALKSGAAGADAVPKRLLDLRMVFAKVYDVCGEMNNVFGIFVLLILTYHNTFIHVEVFHICAQIIDSTLVQSTWKFAHTKEALWAVINIIKILAFFICCGLVLGETKKTGEIVCKYLTNLPAGKLLDSIDCFSRAVAAMKLGFSANGFFTIDWEILFSSASACTINTLILIQSHVNNNYADDRATALQSVGSE